MIKNWQKTKEPLISVITVCLNEKKGIAKTIESVINQSFTNFEFIIIDGLSNDGTVKIVEKYLDKIDYFISENDKGIYSAMNKGIKRARGGFLIFLNAGDYFTHNYVLENVFKGEVVEDIIYGDLIVNKKPKKIVMSFKNIKVNKRFLFNNYLPHPSSFIKKELFERLGLYNEKYEIAGDYDFFLRALVKNNATTKHVEEKITIYDVHGKSMNPKYSKIHSIERKRSKKDNFNTFDYYYYLFLSILGKMLIKK